MGEGDDWLALLSLMKYRDVNRSSVGRLSSHFMKQPHIVIMEAWNLKQNFTKSTCFNDNRSHLLMRVP